MPVAQGGAAIGRPVAALARDLATGAATAAAKEADKAGEGPENND